MKVAASVKQYTNQFPLLFPRDRIAPSSESVKAKYALIKESIQSRSPVKQLSLLTSAYREYKTNGKSSTAPIDTLSSSDDRRDLALLTPNKSGQLHPLSVVPIVLLSEASTTSSVSNCSACRLSSKRAHLGFFFSIESRCFALLACCF